MSQIEARIFQQEYILTCPDGEEEALLNAVARVDGDMERIRQSGRVRARERIGVLTAINLAFENASLTARIEELETAAQYQPIPDYGAEPAPSPAPYAPEAEHAEQLSQVPDQQPAALQPYDAVQQEQAEPAFEQPHQPAFDEAQVYAMMEELQALLAQRELELLEAQALIARMEAALEEDTNLL